MPSLETTNSVPVAFYEVTPVLRVNDLEASLNYYVRMLGFKMDWRTMTAILLPRFLAATVISFSPWAIRAIQEAGCGSE